MKKLFIGLTLLASMLSFADVVPLQVNGTVEKIIINDYIRINKVLDGIVELAATKECQSYSGYLNNTINISALKIDYKNKDVNTETQIFEAMGVNFLELFVGGGNMNRPLEAIYHEVSVNYEATFECEKH